MEQKNEHDLGSLKIDRGRDMRKVILSIAISFIVALAINNVYAATTFYPTGLVLGLNFLVILVMMSLFVRMQKMRMVISYIIKLPVAPPLKYLMNVVLIMMLIFPNVIVRQFFLKHVPVHM